MILFTKTNNKNVFYNNDISLSQLANQFETDKGTANSLDLSWGHDFPNHRCMHYTTTYEKYMNSKKTESINMLEIGVCDKRFPYASIKMWMSYFKNVDFYAVDNFWGHKIGDKVDDIKKLNDQGVNFIYADQGSFEDWDELNIKYPNKFDFVVEDGSHWPNHMVVSLWKSIGIMKSGGYYFMEDIQNPLVSRGWFRYDNSLLAQELLEALSTKRFESRFLNEQQNKDIQENFELVDLILDPSAVNYLAVLRKK
jgi:hypothetical protein